MPHCTNPTARGELEHTSLSPSTRGEGCEEARTPTPPSTMVPTLLKVHLSFQQELGSSPLRGICCSALVGASRQNELAF